MSRRNVPARFPPTGSWPAVMRADMAAAFFDFDTTSAFQAALARGEVPRPTDSRVRGQMREPLWSLDACRSFVTRRHDLGERPESDNLAALL